MPVISTDTVVNGQTSAVSYDSSPETIIIKDDVLVYLYSNAYPSAAIYNDGFTNGKLFNYGHVIGDGISYAALIKSSSFELHNMAGADISSKSSAIYFNGTYNTLENAGRISGDIGFSDGGTISNSSVIEGSISSTVQLNDFQLTNSGILNGHIRITVDTGTFYQRGASIDNSGTITEGLTCNYQAGNFSASIHNTGRIGGDVTLSGGADIFDNRGGQVSGVVGGGAGNDLYIVDATPLSIVEAAGEGSDTVASATVSLDLARYTGIENVSLLGGLNLNASGNADANVLRGNAGVNILKGLGGSDTYYVQNAGDQVVEAVNAGKDTVHASVSYVLPSNVEKLILDGKAAIDGTGNGGSNILIGNGAANRLAGGAGNDIYVVDNADDVVIERADAGGAKYGSDTVLANVSYALTAGQAIEALKANTPGTALDLTGNAFAQTLTGNAGANRLDGMGGNDVLVGGKGADTFVFSTAPGTGNLDHVADFSAAADTVWLSKGIFAALAPGALAESAFKDLGAAGATVDADDRILYDHRTGSLAYDADGSGGGAAVKFAILDNKAAITAADFYVFAL